MKDNSKRSLEVKNSKPLGIQKIEQKILFGASGIWSRYFNALLLLGIDVRGLFIENAKLKDELQDEKETVKLLESMLESKNDKLRFINSVIHSN